MWIIIKEKTVYHQGDERSRTHPSHGYPAYTETVQESKVYPDYVLFICEIEKLEKSSVVYKAYKAEPVTVTKKLVITVN